MIRIKNMIAAVVCASALLSNYATAQDDLATPPAEFPSAGDNLGTENTTPSTIISPDDGTVHLGGGALTPNFEIGRRLHLTGSVLGGYDDNVNLTPKGSPSWYVSPVGNFAYEFGSSRIAFTLILGAAISYYFEHPDGRDYDPNLNLRFAIAYKASPRLTLDFSTLTSYQSQPDYTTQLNVNRRLGSYFRTSDRLFATYRWTPRFSTVTGYDLGALEYESSEGASHDRVTQVFSQDFRYLLFPTTTATAIYRFGITDFPSTDTDTQTQTFAAGVSQTFSPRFSTSVRAGVQLRSTSTGGDRTAPYAEADLRYLFGPREGITGISSGAGGFSSQGSSRGESSGTFISWTNRYSIEESDVVNGTSRQTFRTNLSLSYAITARVSAILNLLYLHGDDEGSTASAGSSSSTEDVFDIGPTLRYAFNQHLSMSVGYRYSEFDRGRSTGTTADTGETFGYSRNRYFAGLSFTF